MISFRSRPLHLELLRTALPTVMRRVYEKYSHALFPYPMHWRLGRLVQGTSVIISCEAPELH